MKTKLQKTAFNLVAISLCLYSASSYSCPSVNYLGAVCFTAANFCPEKYDDANGALLSIADNNALFALIGTQYGGNGRTTFKLPDLRGRVAVGEGLGPGLSVNRQRGQYFGNERIQLSSQQIPPHQHSISGTYNISSRTERILLSEKITDVSSPNGNVYPAFPNPPIGIYTADASQAIVGNLNVDIRKGNGIAKVETKLDNSRSSLDLKQPFEVIRACIAVKGLYPARQ
ncbi:tail fiber protein [Enterovibrio sp. ZSDZ42]|uniref:Tail fiber protein n=1 Tax=Enterovibrio gelatinilyticus TaxID=2899819 RepID=A0ABT5R0S1_9GAMM|nr:tail fiber protein [Enterovibrio sp. ZSDZ42]MDD1793450.1 tail fiber protein [Enterovibrio sp. ZSDZ42]